jgi:hypothetical protein
MILGSIQHFQPILTIHCLEDTFGQQFLDRRSLNESCAEINTFGKEGERHTHGWHIESLPNDLIGSQGVFIRRKLDELNAFHLNDPQQWIQRQR